MKPDPEMEYLQNCLHTSHALQMRRVQEVRSKVDRLVSLSVQELAPSQAKTLIVASPSIAEDLADSLETQGLKIGRATSSEDVIRLFQANGFSAVVTLLTLDVRGTVSLLKESLCYCKRRVLVTVSVNPPTPELQERLRRWNVTLLRHPVDIRKLQELLVVT